MAVGGRRRGNGSNGGSRIRHPTMLRDPMPGSLEASAHCRNERSWQSAVGAFPCAAGRGVAVRGNRPQSRFSNSCLSSINTSAHAWRSVETGVVLSLKRPNAVPRSRCRSSDVAQSSGGRGSHGDDPLRLDAAIECRANAVRTLGCRCDPPRNSLLPAARAPCAVSRAGAVPCRLSSSLAPSPPGWTGGSWSAGRGVRVVPGR
jgi:hypothetical protein